MSPRHQVTTSPIRFSFSLILFLLAALNGCVTVPRAATIPTYSIGGTAYVALQPVCEARDIRFDYDPLTRTAHLSRASHHIALHIGSRQALVDGALRDLKAGVDMYNGVLVVPSSFQAQVLDALFGAPKKESSQDIGFYRIKKIVIDPGHGGKDPGAPGRSGVDEKVITLDIAQRLAGLLRARGVEVVMTRTADKFLSLTRRADLALTSQSDLFISIHANANPARSLSGFEVYHITPDINDTTRALNAAKGTALPVDRGSFLSLDATLKAIVWDLTYGYDRREAIALADHICKAMGCTVDARIIGVKSANFCVLRGSCVPAVLVEVGFLSNLQEEQLLNDGAYRQKIAEGIMRGIQDYARQYAESGAAAAPAYVLQSVREGAS